ncbi:MAG: hypothetical protein V4659_04000 [Pseudomonadota bacterium]
MMGRLAQVSDFPPGSPQIAASAFAKRADQMARPSRPLTDHRMHSSQGAVWGDQLEKSFAKSTIAVDRRRKWFSGLMWRAFPGASMREKALNAAEVLDLTPRQCENLIKGEHDAKLGTILAVLTIAGAESIFDIVGGRE